MIDALPKIALSIRQPWAWLIVNGWKNIETFGNLVDNQSSGDRKRPFIVDDKDDNWKAIEKHVREYGNRCGFLAPV